METEQFPERISKETLKELPLGRFEGSIHVISEQEQVEQIVSALENEKILGFDTETRPSFKKGIRHNVSLLQLATSEAVYLIRLNYVAFSEPLLAILENPEILKIGVAVHDDIKALQSLSTDAFEPGGFVDLSQIARKLKIITSGLRSLAGIFLGIRISKNSQVSNWETPRLSSSQITYAATDAWICREMYLYLKNLGVLESLDDEASDSQEES